MGIVIGWGNLNGVVASNIYRNKPRYYPGHGTVLAYLTVFLCIGSIVTRFGLQRENKKRLSGKRDEWTQGMGSAEMKSLADGDRRYVHFLLLSCLGSMVRSHGDADLLTFSPGPISYTRCRYRESFHVHPVKVYWTCWTELK